MAYPGPDVIDLVVRYRPMHDEAKLALFEAAVKYVNQPHLATAWGAIGYELIVFEGNVMSNLLDWGTPHWIIKDLFRFITFPSSKSGYHRACKHALAQAIQLKRRRERMHDEFYRDIICLRCGKRIWFIDGGRSIGRPSYPAVDPPDNITHIDCQMTFFRHKLRGLRRRINRCKRLREKFEIQKYFLFDRLP